MLTAVPIYPNTADFRYVFVVREEGESYFTAYGLKLLDEPLGEVCDFCERDGANAYVEHGATGAPSVGVPVHVHCVLREGGVIAYTADVTFVDPPDDGEPRCGVCRSPRIHVEQDGMDLVRFTIHTTTVEPDALDLPSEHTVTVCPTCIKESGMLAAQAALGFPGWFALGFLTEEDAVANGWDEANPERNPFDEAPDDDPVPPTLAHLNETGHRVNLDWCGPTDFSVVVEEGSILFARGHNRDGWEAVLERDAEAGLQVALVDGPDDPYCLPGDLIEWVEKLTADWKGNVA